MYSMVSTAIVRGIESIVVAVEADVSDGMPVFDMVGLLGSEVKEARERVRTALRNAGCRLPAKRITVNLSPANIHKAGASFDLPIAVAILTALGLVEREYMENLLIAGEIGLNGAVLPVEGILPMAAGAKERGMRGCLVASANVAEASLIEGLEVYGVDSIAQLIARFRGPVRPETQKSRQISFPMAAVEKDFAEMRGQQFLKRACEIAVSGMHNLLMSGPPGSGKTMAAQRIAGILPPLTREEQLEISKIYSVSGLLREQMELVTSRPFRSPHHTVTPQAMAGGGRIAKPGEIALANGGVLFLDELTEFNRDTLEILRQPLEDRQISIARVNGNVCYPADFLLVAAMNPCACGYYPDRNRCCCTDSQLARYRNKLSQPLLDRIDICIVVPRLTYEELSQPGRGKETSAQIRERVVQVQQIEQERFRGTGLRYNSQIPASMLAEYCPLGKKEQEYMKNVYRRMALSARSYHKILKVARTIADMEQRKEIGISHLTEAVCYRSFEKKGEGESF